MCRLISHRLRSFDKQESTAAGLLSALEYSVQAVEIDTRVTKDGAIIISHDACLKREFNRDWMIAETTLREILNLRKTITGCQIMTLEEFLTIIKNHPSAAVKIFLDIKETGYEQKIIEVLDKYALLPDTIIISWLPECLSKINSLNSGIPLCFSHHNSKNRMSALTKMAIIGTSERIYRKHPLTKLIFEKYNRHTENSLNYSAGMDYEHFAVSPLKGRLAEMIINTGGYVCCHYTQADPDTVRLYHNMGIKVIVYSIDNKQHIIHYQEKVNPDYILTNNMKAMIT